MKSVIAKRSIMVHEHKTSVSLEEQFWVSLKTIAMHKQVKLSALISEIDHAREHNNLSSALRLFVLAWYRGEAPGPVSPERPPVERVSSAA